MGVTDFLLLSFLGFAITAHAQDCSVPVGGPNMHLKDEYILKETFASGDQAAFACNTGYISDGGSPSITCTAGSWSTVRLTCKRKTCGSPGDVEHGHIDYPKGNLFGDHMEITCNDGYRLVGKSRIICGAQGWMDRLPRCEVVTCDLPPLVSDATFTPHKDSYDHGEAVRYSCTAGLTLSGPTLISCSNNGTFQPAPPTCVKVECEDLDILNADWISGSRPPHGHKAVVEYKCRKGFKMVGQSTLICEINSQWSPKPPRCDVVTCKSPSMLAKGTFSPAKEVYKYGDVVRYSCQTGFKLSGSNATSCSDDGTFKPDPPTCTMVTCKSPPMLAKGIFSPVKEVYKYGEVVQYSCEAGLTLSGSESASCSDDGTFKPDPPTFKSDPPTFKSDPPTFKSDPPTCTSAGNSGKVVGAAIGTPLIVVALSFVAYRYRGLLPSFRKKQGNQKRLRDSNASKADEEVALSDGVSLKQSSTGNGQESGGTEDKPPVMSPNNV